MISQVGDKFEYLKYATPLTLFNTDAILVGDSAGFAGMAVLFVVGIIFYSAGITAFCKNDMPL